MAQGFPDYVGSIFVTLTSVAEDLRYMGNGGGSTVATKWHQRIPQTWRGVSRTTDAHMLANYVTLQRFAIIDVDQGNKYFYIGGDQTLYFPQYKKLSVRGSTGNDYEGISITHEPYYVAASSYNAGTNRTRITTSQAIASAVVDGWIYSGLFVVKAGNYSVNVSGLARGQSTNGGFYRFCEVGAGITYDSNGCYSAGGTPYEAGINPYTGNATTLGDYSVGLQDYLVIVSEVVLELQQYAGVSLANYGLGTTWGSGGIVYGIPSRTLSVVWTKIG